MEPYDSSQEDNAASTEVEGPLHLNVDLDTVGTASLSLENLSDANNTGNYAENHYPSGRLGHTIHNTARTKDHLVPESHDEIPQVSSTQETKESHRPLKSGRGRSCRTFVAGLSGSRLENTEQNESHSPTTHENGYLGKPEPLQKKFMTLHFDGDSPSLSRNNSHSSTESAYAESHNQCLRASQEDGIPSLQTFVKGLKEAQLHYDNQQDGQVHNHSFCV